MIVAAVLMSTFLPVFEALAQAPQADGGRCATRFPESVFETEADAGPVEVFGSGVTQPLLDRYASDWRDLIDLIQAEMGGLDGGVVVCVFDDLLPLDAEALGWAPNQFLRAVAFGDERVVVVSSWLIAEASDAGRNGLLHVAEYQVTDGSYPEPFGDDVKGWYRNRVERTVEVVHNAFVRQNSGLSEPWQPFPWTVGRMIDPLLWNPELGYGGGGDFTNYAVANGGTAVLSSPHTSDLTLLDVGWRQTLFDESGAIPGGSKGWILGLVLAVGIVVLGIGMAWWSRRQRRALDEKLRDLEWLERLNRESADREAVRVSAAPGGGSRDSGVGRRRSTSRSIDRNGGDGAPSRRERRPGDDRVADRGEAGDDMFRHPGFDHDD